MSEFFTITKSKPTQWLGMELAFSDNCSTIKHEQMIVNLAKAIGAVTPAPTPMVTGINLSQTETEPLSEEGRKNFQSVLGTLMFIACGSRPDISYALSALGQYTASPTKTHQKALTRVVQYLYGTKDDGLVIGENWDSTIRVFSDASFPGPRDNRHGQSGYTVTWGHNIVAWKSCRQRLQCLSTTESEFVAATSGAQEGLWVLELLKKIAAMEPVDLQIITDSMSAKQVAEKQAITEKMKHVDVRDQWLKEKVADGVLTIHYINGGSNPANVLTKPVGKEEMDRFRKWMKREIAFTED